VRILLVTPMPPQPQATNGVALVTWSQIAALAPRHELSVVTVAGPDQAELAALSTLTANGVTVHAVRRIDPTGWRRQRRRWRLARGLAVGRDPFRTSWYYEPGLQRLLDGLLAGGRFDLIQLDDNAVGVYHYRTTTPLVITEHEVRRPRAVDWQGWRRAGWRHWLREETDWRRWERYQRRVWQRGDLIQVFTERDATAIGSIAPALAPRVRVNPFGLVLPPPADPDREERDTVVFTGGFAHQPNVDAALWLAREIMPRVRARRPGARLLLVGSYPPREVRQLADDDTIVTGRVPEIEPYLERASVVAAPVRFGGGMRTKVLQGMALGKPVVTTPLGAEGLAFEGRRPPLARAADADEAAEATARLLASTADRRALGAAARAFVDEHFSERAYGRRLEAVYAELLSARAGAPEPARIG
jgi:glycosyltransferase involved in cell wall biosynthesis